MSSRDVEILAGKLKNLSEMVRPRTDLSKEEIDRIEHEAWVGGERSELRGGPEANILLLTRDLEALASLVSFVQGLFPGEVSDKFVRDELVSTLFELRGKSGKALWSVAQKGATELITGIESMPGQHEVVLPIMNLALPSGPLRIGAVRFYPRQAEDLFSELIASYDRFHPRRIDFRAVKVYAVITVRARDDHQVDFNALSLAETAFNVIRLFRSYESYRWYGVLKAVAVEELSERAIWRRPLGGSQEEPQKSYSYSLGPLGASAPFTIRPDFLAYIRQYYFDQIGDLCFAEPASDDETHRRIVDAVHWAGQAKTDPSPEDAFVKQWIALEVLLSPYRRATGRAISDAAAYLLSRRTVEDRMKMSDHFHDFWKTRNKIVHRGLRVDASTLESLANDVTLAISVLAKKHEEGMTNFARWFKQQKYSTQSDQTREI